MAAVREHFASLPPERFPLLSSLADVMTAGTGEERVAFAIDVMVAGLKALARREG